MHQDSEKKIPTAWRRWFHRDDQHADDSRGVTAMRVLHSLLRQPHARRRYALAVRLLRQGPFSLSLLLKAREMEPGVVTVKILDGRAENLDLALVQESLGSQISPLIGMSDVPRWISLSEDPFRPGCAFLRRFNLASAFVLPLAENVPGGEDRLFLLGASYESLFHGSPLIQEILVMWSLERTLTAARQREQATSCHREQDWPGLVAWLETPVALAIVAGDEVVRANTACENLLTGCVGSDGRSWQLWLAASVRRLLEAGRNREILPASQARQTRLEVVIGSPLSDGESRIVTVRDATAEVLADSRSSETISTLSHELRTPLTSMKNSVNLVLRGDAGPLSENQQRFLIVTMRNIDRLDRLIGDLLDASRAAAGQLALRRRLVDLGVLLREALDMLAATARQRGITLDYVGVPATFPAHVDPDKVIQMIHNTVGNALKYTEEGGFVRVWLRTRQGQLLPLTTMIAERFFLPLRTFTLVVEDNGMGMSEEVLDNLFRPYSRGKEAEATQVPGTGLGMHITRGLVEAHGGNIDLTSSPDMGTTVWIVLPRDPDSERVLVAARRLTDRLQASPNDAVLMFLDTRRPDRVPEEKELHQATRTIEAFLTRLNHDANLHRDPAKNASAEQTPQIDVAELAPGLWATIGLDYSRIESAWQVEQAKPNCPSLLVDTTWDIVEPPANEETEKESHKASPEVFPQERH